MEFSTIHIILICVLVIAAYKDLKTNKISNRLILTGLVAEVIVVIVNKNQLLINMIFNMLIIFLILLIPFALRGIGAGDVKLFMLVWGALGIHKGLIITLVAFLIFILVAGVKKIMGKEAKRLQMAPAVLIATVGVLVF